MDKLRRKKGDSDLSRGSKRSRRSSSRISKGDGSESLKEKLKALSSLEDFKAIHALKDGYEPFMEVNMEKLLWKAHHRRISDFRSRMQEISERERSSVISKKTLKNVVAPFLEFITSSSNFYRTLIGRIRVKHGLSSDISDGWRAVECNHGVKETHDFYMSCHRLLMHLGDLARYKEVYGVSLKNKNYSVAEEHYLQAAKLCHCNGDSHSQLAVLATHTEDKVRAIYHYLRSMFAQVPAPMSHGNLLLLLKNKMNASERHNQMACNFENFSAVAELLLLKTSFQGMQELLDSSLKELEEWLSSERRRTREKVFLGLQIATILMCSIQDFYMAVLCKTSQPRTALHQTLNSAFKVINLVLSIEDPSASMLPALVIFTWWLSSSDDVLSALNENGEVKSSFLNLLERSEGFFQALSLSSELFMEVDNFALWEDHELKGFILLRNYHEKMNFGMNYQDYDDRQLNFIRLRRLESILDKLVRTTGLRKLSLSDQREADIALDSQLVESQDQLISPDIVGELFSITPVPEQAALSLKSSSYEETVGFINQVRQTWSSSEGRDEDMFNMDKETNAIRTTLFLQNDDDSLQNDDSSEDMSQPDVEVETVVPRIQDGYPIESVLNCRLLYCCLDDEECGFDDETHVRPSPDSTYRVKKRGVPKLKRHQTENPFIAFLNELKGM